MYFDAIIHEVISSASLSQRITLGGIKMSRFADLKNFVDGMEDDFSKFYDKGNKAAGTRVRKAMQDIKKMAQDIRVEVQNKKND